MPRIDSQAEHKKKHTDDGNVMGNCCHLVVVWRTSVYSSGPLIEPTPHYKPKKKVITSSLSGEYKYTGRITIVFLFYFKKQTLQW